MELNSGATGRISKSDSGPVLGGGILYRLGRVNLRGHVESMNIQNAGEVLDVGVSVELEF